MKSSEFNDTFTSFMIELSFGRYSRLHARWRRRVRRRFRKIETDNYKLHGDSW